jgi:hypothetical protein
LNEIARGWPGSGQGGTVAGRCNTELADEGASHVTPVSEAHLQSRLGESLAIDQELLCKAHAPLNEVGMRRYSYFACEATQQPEAAHAR